MRALSASLLPSPFGRLGSPRLPAIQKTELRTRLLSEQPAEAIARFSEEKKTIVQFARATFDTAIGKNPSAFLSDNMKVQGTTFDLITEIYQSAQRIGAFTEAQIRNASDMFEYCRSEGIAGKSMFKWGSMQATQALTGRLRYLMACLDDIGRAESLKLLADELRTKGVSFKDIQEQPSQREEVKQHRPAECGTHRDPQRNTRHRSHSKCQHQHAVGMPAAFSRKHVRDDG